VSDKTDVLVDALEAIKELADADETFLCWKTANDALEALTRQAQVGDGIAAIARDSRKLTDEKTKLLRSTVERRVAGQVSDDTVVERVARAIAYSIHEASPLLSGTPAKDLTHDEHKVLARAALSATNSEARETSAMREQQKQFRERCDHEYLTAPPSSEHGFNQFARPDDVPTNSEAVSELAEALERARDLLMQSPHIVSDEIERIDNLLAKLGSRAP
jgi:hypothetical protein